MESSDIIQKAEKLLGEFIEQLGFSAQFESETLQNDDGNEVIFIVVKGEDLSELIGYHGKNIESLQHVLNISLNNDLEEGNRVRVIIDINDYRKKREEYLRSVAEKALANVRESMQTVALPAMRSSERRIIHMALKNEVDVVTTSEGEEPERYVVIKPL